MRSEIPEAIAFAFGPPLFLASALLVGSPSCCKTGAAGRFKQLSETMDKLALAARKRPELAFVGHHFPPDCASALRERRPGPRTEARTPVWRSLSDASGLPGRRLRQPIQSFRAAVEGLSSSRTGIPHQHRQINSFSFETPRER